jgi:CO dehydrogenase nickel-insertion accessory protein CooC1
MAEDSGLDILGLVPEDEAIAECDATGTPLTDLTDASPSVNAVREILQRTGVAGKE